ncbi:MAG: hypothetical protein P9M11_04920 [Candidatus Tenebribacter burtonii]|jgi:hypothetical protein|nr:hypothetical protein [Candidatus Tenebribacter burtonii]
MKNYLILFVIIYAISLTAQNFTFYSDITVETKYNSNILNLSQSDLDRFESGIEPNKFSLETSDDMITSAKVVLNLKHRLMAGHTQINRITVKYDKFLKNGFEDNYYMEFALKQYLSKKLNFGIYYYYHPGIYVNRYDSVLDDENIFRDFTYSKNNYIWKVNYSLNSKFQFNYKFGFSQLFYNEYFTEYDAENFENGIEIKIIPKDWININAGYIFKISNAKAGDAFSCPELVTIIKNGSYITDIFDLTINFPALISVFSKPVNFTLGAKYEDIFFQAENQLDEYHYGREDKIVTFDSDAKYKITNDFSLKYFYKYKFRNTNSPFTNVEVDKEYNLYETGLLIVFSL